MKKIGAGNTIVPAIAIKDIINRTININVAMNEITVDTNVVALNSALTNFQCEYDFTDGTTTNIAQSCSSLAGFNFDATTQKINWSPTLAEVGTYTFKIDASISQYSDEEIFLIIVQSVNTPPLLNAIPDQAIAETIALSAVDASNTTTNTDFDIDGNLLTYTCSFDTTVDGAVGGAAPDCSTLSGAVFDVNAGTLAWTPNYSQSGNYEFKIIGSDTLLTDSEIFSVTVAHTNAPPVLNSISNQTLAEGNAIALIDPSNVTTNDDTDIDGDALTYSCIFDNSIDAGVAGTASACTTITGLTFDVNTGAVSWTPSYIQAGTYELKITATDSLLSDSELIALTVTNTNRAPQLNAIADQAGAAEANAITTINASDVTANNDSDVDGETLTYSCFYDTTSDGAVAATTGCASLAGVSFTASTGVMNWTPSYTQSGTYEFIITATDSALTDSEIFTITVAHTNAPPEFNAISDQTTGENNAITAVNSSNVTTNNDTDIDGDALAYTCYYDSTVDAAVASVTLCTALTGVNFNGATGSMTWRPNFTQSGSYEFKIISSDGSLTDSEIFVITVTQVNAPPELNDISDQTVAETSAITAINASNVTTNNDTDIDGNTLTYTCYYDTTVNGTVASSTACSTLTGISFNGTTGAMTWTPNYSQSGNYEFKIIASDSSLTGSDLFTITVTNTNRAPVLNSITVAAPIFDVFDNTLGNASDSNTSNDTDIDGDAITYTCFYDTTVDAAVASTTACSTLSGFTLNSSTGAIAWNPAISEHGLYEFKIVGSDGTGSGSTIFTVTVKDSFVSTWITTTNNESITFPTRAGFSYNALIDWGDGSSLSVVTSPSDADRIHVFASPGTYTIKVSGSFTAFSMNNSADRLKLLTVPALGEVGWVSFLGAFYGCTNLTTVDGGDTSGVTDMFRMFFLAPNAVPDTSGWNTSNVTNMSQMFSSATLANPDTSGWNTGNVTTMANMFYAAPNAAPDTSNWNTTKVTTMGAMFQQATSADPDTSGWNTANVTNMNSMFYQATSANPDTSGWNTAKVTDMSRMFLGAINAYPNTSGWVTNLVTNMSNMFQGSPADPDVSGWNTGNVTNMTGMFYSTANADPDTTNWNTVKVTNMSMMFYSALSARPNTTNWSTANVTSMNTMFRNAPLAQPVTTNWVTSKVTDMSYMFYQAAAANPDTSNWNTSLVTNMTSMFHGAINAEPITTNWNTGNVILMTNLFYGAVKANPSTTNWDVSNVTSMSAMFQGAIAANPNTTNWVTTKVTTMNSMFEGTDIANPNTANWDTSNVTDMGSMFNGALAANPNTTNWNTSKVTNMNSMFQQAQAANPNTANWNTSLVTDMGALFRTCPNCNPNTTNWNTANVTNMSQIFNSSPLANPNVSNWSFANVTTIGTFSTALSTSAYSALLNRIAATSTQLNVSLAAGGSKYDNTTASAARATLISNGWTITDGGPAP